MLERKVCFRIIARIFPKYVHHLPGEAFLNYELMNSIIILREKDEAEITLRALPTQASCVHQTLTDPSRLDPAAAGMRN